MQRLFRKRGDYVSNRKSRHDPWASTSCKHPLLSCLPIRMHLKCELDGSGTSLRFQFLQRYGVVLGKSSTRKAIPSLLESSDYTFGQLTAVTSRDVLLHLLRATCPQNYTVFFAQYRMVHNPPQRSLLQRKTYFLARSTNASLLLVARSIRRRAGCKRKRRYRAGAIEGIVPSRLLGREHCSLPGRLKGE